MAVHVRRGGCFRPGLQRRHSIYGCLPTGGEVSMPRSRALVVNFMDVTIHCLFGIENRSDPLFSHLWPGGQARSAQEILPGKRWKKERT